MGYCNSAPDVNNIMYLQSVKLSLYFQSVGRPLATISILGLNCYGSSPEKREEEHISETINKIKPSVSLIDFFSVILKIVPSLINLSTKNH